MSVPEKRTTWKSWLPHGLRLVLFLGLLGLFQAKNWIELSIGVAAAVGLLGLTIVESRRQRRSAGEVRFRLGPLQATAPPDKHVWWILGVIFFGAGAGILLLAQPEDLSPGGGAPVCLGLASVFLAGVVDRGKRLLQALFGVGLAGGGLLFAWAGIEEYRTLHAFRSSAAFQAPDAGRFDARTRGRAGDWVGLPPATPLEFAVSYQPGTDHSGVVRYSLTNPATGQTTVMETHAVTRDAQGQALRLNAFGLLNLRQAPVPVRGEAAPSEAAANAHGDD